MRRRRDMPSAPFPAWLGATLVGAAFVVLSVLERRRPLRPRVEPAGRHLARNLGVMTLSFATVRLVETPLVLPLAQLVEARRWGLLQQLALPLWVEVPLGVVLLDYTLWVWHVATHRVPVLWRFHQVHHVDRDLDASTALRFHAGEILLSVPWRAAQVALLGTGVLALTTWQTVLLVSILFHHANLRLPIGLERRLVRLVATPRLHGIHHSDVRDETDANWASLLTIWDRLHGTLRLDVPQDAVRIGVPAHARPGDVALPRLLALPFGSQRPSWETAPGAPAGHRPLPAPGGELAA
jgi:sterol desaturase/sphingolipid hydroxylase (fatty acid hydroxylase superfamily)